MGKGLTRNQATIYRACLSGDYRRIVVRAGRKFGKTYVSARVARAWAVNTGGTILVAAPEYSYLRDQTLPELMRAIPRAVLAGESWDDAYKRGDNSIRLRNGGAILMRSMENADSVRPLSVDGLIAEEFSLWSPYAWQECVKPTLMARRAPALFIFTPKGMNQAYHEWVRAERGDDGYIGFHYTSWDGVVPRESIDAEAAGLPDSVVRQEFYAEFLDELGGVFHGVDDCVAGDFQPPIPGRSYVMGVDLGKTDATVPIVLDVESKHVAHIDRVTALDWKTQRALIASTARRYNDAVIWLDSTGLGDPIYDELVADGLRVKPYRFSVESKRALIEKLVIAIAERRITFPYNAVLVNELKIYQAHQLKSGGISYSAPAGYHDDAVIALALAVWGAGKAVCSVDVPRYFGERGFPIETVA